MSTQSASDRRKRQPGLFIAAEAACCYRFTDGFCTPRNVASCRCWDAAEQVIAATGLSAQGAAWLFQNLSKIEKEADK